MKEHEDDEQNVYKTYTVNGEKHFIKVRKSIQYIAKDYDGNSWGYKMKPSLDFDEDDEMWLMNEKDDGRLQELGIVAPLENILWNTSLRRLKLSRFDD